MGVMTEQGIARQLAKMQGETNDRLDRLIRAQERTNQLLEWLGSNPQPSVFRPSTG